MDTQTAADESRRFTVIGICVTVIFGLFTIAQVLSEQLLQRKQFAHELVQSNVAEYDARMSAAFSDFMTLPPETQRLLFDPSWTHSLNEDGLVLSSREYRAEVNHFINLILVQATEYNTHTADRRILWSQSFDALMSTGERQPRSVLQVIIDIHKGSSTGRIHHATLVEYQERMENGRPSAVAEWLGVDRWVALVITLLAVGGIISAVLYKWGGALLNRLSVGMRWMTAYSKRRNRRKTSPHMQGDRQRPPTLPPSRSRSDRTKSS